MSEILLIKPKITLRLFCPFCISNKNRSRKFSTIYALKYHLNQHEGEFYTKVLNLEHVRQTLCAIETAIEIGMVRN